MFLKEFSFPDSNEEMEYIYNEKRTCFKSYYPFKILSDKNCYKLKFDQITILHGGNGSGKTTALNIISEKLKIKRATIFNKSNFFDDYLKMCNYFNLNYINNNSRIITSDDVFDYILNVRHINEGIDYNREVAFQDYVKTKNSNFKFKTMNDYEELSKVVKTRSITQSQYTRENVAENVREKSNGESAFMYFVDKIQENGLYLLDEPENSLSPEKQVELVAFLEESARFFNCQFIISTHSPYLLAIKGAKIYDLDELGAPVKKWTELKNVVRYYEFFKKHEDEFK